MPYLTKALFGSDLRAVWRAGSATGKIPGRQATILLLKAFDDKQEDRRRAAMYGLVNKPYRSEAKRAYLEMIRKQVYLGYAVEAAVEYRWKEALPDFARIVQSPADLYILRTAFEASRSLEGRTLAADMVKAQRDVQSASFSRVDDRPDLKQSRRALMEAKDFEAAPKTGSV